MDYSKKIKIHSWMVILHTIGKLEADKVLVTQRSIYRNCNMSTTTIVADINMFEKEGIITKSISPSCKRRYEIIITKKGNILLNLINPLMNFIECNEKK